MVIQRVQTLYLLLAIACVIAFLFMPFGYWDETLSGRNLDLVALEGSKLAALLVPGCLAVLLMFISIFLFKKLPLQKSIVALSAIVVVAMMLVVVYIMTLGFNISNPEIDIKPTFGGSGLLLIGALVVQIAAYRAISRDQKLLRSYDRLR